MNILQSVIIASAVLAAAGSSSVSAGGRNKISFQHTTDKTLKTDCVEIRGKYDAFPRYTCFDDKGDSQPVNPGPEWTPVKLEKVCFMHKVHDSIRVCVEIIDPKDKSTSGYACAVKDKPPRPFEPTEDWEKLTAEDKRCAPRLQSFEVPKKIEMPAPTELRKPSSSHVPQ